MKGEGEGRGRGRGDSQIHMSSLRVRTSPSEEFVDFVIYAFNLMDFF